MGEARDKVQVALDKCEENNNTEWSALKTAIRDSLGRFLFEKTRRRPMISMKTGLAARLSVLLV